MTSIAARQDDRLSGVASRYAIGWPVLGVAALVVAVCISPRIPAPLSVGRRFDVRLEDFVLLVLTAAWLWRRDYRAILGLRRAQLFLGFLAAGALSTAVNTAFYGLPPLRGVSFWGKYVEYFLIFVITATWMRSVVDRKVVVRVLLVMGVLNAAWVGLQLVTGSYRSVIELSSVNEFSYGPGLIGEISPLSAGSFFLIQFLVWWAVLADRLRWPEYAASAAMLIALVLTESRVSYLGAALGAAVIAWQSRRRWILALGFGAAFAAGTVLLISSGNPSAGRITTATAIEESLAYRVDEIWSPLAKKYAGIVLNVPSQTPAPVQTPRYYGSDLAPPPPTAAARRPPTVVQALIGFGNGSMGYAPGLPTEAHDYFVRTYLESGVLGLAAFIGLLANVLLLAFTSWRGHAAPRTDRVVSAALMGLVAAFIASAFLQDMFFPVIPNELLWLLVGLCTAAAISKPDSTNQKPQAAKVPTA